MAEYHVVGVSHIDMAFVMRKEAYAEMVEILLERVISVLNRHPGVHFALEQAAHYRNLEKNRPDLFQKVKELLKSGRLEFMGGMATTAETNFPNGECFIRNQGMGLRWLEEHLDVKPEAGWLVDTFGLNPQIPQIMEQFGFKYLYANRFGGNKRWDIFQAEGLNGSRVVVIGCDSASINVLPETQSLIFCRAWGDVDTLFAKADRLEGRLPKLVTYYIENEEVFSEYYLKLTDRRKENGDWRHSTHRAFCEAFEQSGYVPPVVKDDLNPEFTGTFALRTPIKTENRKAECALLNAEIWHALLSDEKQAPLADAWWELFHCQFHDAFTGSHEDITYEDILRLYAAIQDCSLAVQKSALRIVEDENSIVCCNSLPWPRSEWVCMDMPGKMVSVYDGKKKLPVCRVGDKLCFLAELPAGGIVGYTLREDADTPEQTATGGREISNEHLRLVLSDRNGIALLENRQGNTYISGAGNFLVAEQDRGGMQIERCEGREIYAATGKITVEEATSDLMGEHIAMSGQFPKMPWNPQNTLSWRAEFSLRRGERFLRLKLTLNWNGDGTRIRLKLPLAIEGRDFFNEVPFGVTRREAYQNLPTAKGEWPVQRFACLENGSRGVALINRGVAGVQQEGRTIVSTLIRAYADGPDAWVKPTALSGQHGERVFEFAVMPYEGGYRNAGVIRTALAFNQTVQLFRGASDLCDSASSRFNVRGEGIVLSSIKKAWDGSGDLVIRLYESEGKQTAGELIIPDAETAWHCDLRENKKEKLMFKNYTLALKFAPYEIKTVRLARKPNL